MNVMYVNVNILNHFFGKNDERNILDKFVSMM